MSLVTTSKLGIAPGVVLFSDLDITINSGDRLGIVAPNGGGKSSLLRCLAGLLEPTSGACRRARGGRVTLMMQDPDGALLGETLRTVIAGALPPESRDWDRWRVDVACDALQIPDALRDRPLDTLSGGWQRMALIARAALDEPDLMLLDEPTNHLDLERIGILQRFIAGLPADRALVIASHDRAFLDAVTTRTLFLRASGSVDFPLPYSRARASLAERDAADARRHEVELRQAAQLRRQAAKLNNIGINSGSDLLTVKTRQLTRRAELIEEQSRPAGSDATAGRIQLAESGTEAKVMLALSDAVVSAPDGRRLFATGKLWIRPGDRVVLLGANGSGKSLFLGQAAMAMRGASVAGFACSPSIIPGIADQTLSHLGSSETLHAALVSRFSIGDQRIRALLAGAGFPVERQSQRVAILSGGQRARLAMLILRLEQPNFYLLDEPTNHLDIDGQEALEAELTRGEAAALIVSHDRRFVENVGSRFWQIERGRIREIDDPQPFFAAMLAARA